MAGHGPSERSHDPGIRLVLAELRDLRLEMRADRQRGDSERQRADEERRQDRRLSDLRFEKAMSESDQRFERAIRESREHVDKIMLESREHFDKVMRVNRNTRILERIERRLGGPGPWRPGQGNGRGGAHR